MAATQDQELFFQSTQSLGESERKIHKSANTHGSPIRIPSKILAITLNPLDSNSVYVAESTGTARKVDIESGESEQVYKGPAAPLTSLAIPPNGGTLYAGSWDKAIWSWDSTTCALGRRFHGHTDFVKALLFFRNGKTDVLISGGADACIIIWNALTGERLHTLKGHSRGILALALDPHHSRRSDVAIFSASSDPHIRRWRINKDLSEAEEVESENPVLQHDTSINALRFDDDGDLWTASSDGTAKCLSRERGWQADTVLQHGDYVRGIAVDEVGGLIASVGRDEEVKIWQRGSGKLEHVYSGHFEEISGCLLLPGQKLVTVGIDCTLRHWSLRSNEIERVREEAASKLKADVAMACEPEALLTEEEEQELDELMKED